MRAGRYNELRASGGLLTPREQKTWHYCLSLNGKLINVADAEFARCSCKDGNKIRKSLEESKKDG